MALVDTQERKEKLSLQWWLTATLGGGPGQISFGSTVLQHRGDLWSRDKMASEVVRDLLSGVDLDNVMVSVRNLDSTSDTVSLGWTSTYEIWMENHILIIDNIKVRDSERFWTPLNNTSTGKQGWSQQNLSLTKHNWKARKDLLKRPPKSQKPKPRSGPKTMWVRIVSTGLSRCWRASCLMRWPPSSVDTRSSAWPTLSSASTQAWRFPIQNLMFL